MTIVRDVIPDLMSQEFRFGKRRKRTKWIRHQKRRWKHQWYLESGWDKYTSK